MTLERLGALGVIFYLLRIKILTRDNLSKLHNPREPLRPLVISLRLLPNHSYHIFYQSIKASSSLDGKTMLLYKCKYCSGIIFSVKVPNYFELLVTR